MMARVLPSALVMRPFSSSPFRWKWTVEGDFSLGLVCPRPALREEAVCRRKPGALHHLAFRADSDAEVDRLYEQVRAIEGVTIVAPPGRYPEYTPDYYAFFFKDTEGIKLEIVHFERPAYY